MFNYQRKIFGFQCDIYGHVNNSEYLRIYEEARSEALEEMKLSLEYLNEKNIQIFVKTAKIDYKKSIKMGETINIKSKVKKFNKVKSTWLQEIYNDKNELCNVFEILAIFTRAGKPLRLPKDIYNKFLKFK